MAYADQSMSSRRVVAIGIVALLHAVIGYAFVTGLAYNVVKKVAQDLKTFDVEEEPPPPEELPPPPPPEQKVEPPPVLAPPPIVQVQNVAPPPVTTVREAPPVVITPTAPPAPPPPPPPALAAKASERGNSSLWVTTEDYPSRALREEREGTVTVAWDVDAGGKVVNCRVTASSGHPDLDEAACRNITRRGRYKPAKDSAGNDVPSSGYSRRVRWQMPKD
ncbi:outer membrane transport energization protein TonB [Sphingomonas laterariae]|uniref:Protein TonB n=1 Tax=Edaphosphingomonas laterariae TaxID=861865 RepID=A0A239G731_9SPHN|nr:energy transducer TonB [Sphingomonas laterariae]SNS64512.1 outer membrane transport energization protein TonB [Sphingomonas laterariae]